MLALSGCVAYPYGDAGGYGSVGYGYGGYGYSGYGYAGPAVGPAVVVGPGYGYRPYGDRGAWHGGDRGNRGGWSRSAQSRGASPPPPRQARGGGGTPRVAPYRGAAPRSNPGGPDGGPSR